MSSTDQSRVTHISSDDIATAQAELKKSLSKLTGAALEDGDETGAEDLRAEIEKHQQEITDDWIKTLKDK